MFKCRKCAKDKDLSEFYKTPKGHRFVCKSCCNQEATNRQRENPDKQRWKQMKHRYGLTQKDWENRLQKQNYKCAICRTELHTAAIPRNEKRPPNLAVVDHCHITNQVRGILCHGCNVAIGHMKDNIDILTSAIFYLKGYKNDNSCNGLLQSASQVP